MGKMRYCWIFLCVAYYVVTVVALGQKSEIGWPPSSCSYPGSICISEHINRVQLMSSEIPKGKLLLPGR